MLFCCKWLPPAIKTINFRSKTTSTFVWFVHRRTRSWNSRKDSENVLFVRSLLTVRDASWGCIELVLTWIKGHVKSLSRKESLIIGENINVGNSNYNHSAAQVVWCENTLVRDLTVIKLHECRTCRCQKLYISSSRTFHFFGAKKKMWKIWTRDSINR